MKILMIQPCHIGYGGYFRSYALAQNLRSSGVAVDHVATGIDNRFFYKTNSVEGSNKDLWMPKWNVNHFITGRLYRSLLILVYVVINQNKYSRIHFFNIVQFECWIPAFFLSIFSKKKIIIDWDDYWTDGHLLVPVYNNILIKSYLSGLEAISKNYFLKFTVASSFLYKKISRNEKLIVKNVGDQREEIFGVEDVYNNNSPVFLSIGNTLFKERAIYLYRFILEVRKYRNDAKVVTNVALSDIGRILINEGVIQEVGQIDGIIKSIGYIKHEDLPGLLKQCDATIFFTGETSLEMACSPTRISTFRKIGLPLVTNTTNTDYYRDLRNTNCIVDGKSIKEIAQHFNQLYSDPVGWKKFKEQCNKNWHEYPVWSDEVEQLIKFYE